MTRAMGRDIAAGAAGWAFALAAVELDGRAGATLGCKGSYSRAGRSHDPA